MGHTEVSLKQSVEAQKSGDAETHRRFDHFELTEGDGDGEGHLGGRVGPVGDVERQEKGFMKKQR